MKMKHKILTATCLASLICHTAAAQLFTDQPHPRGYFQWPVRSSIEIAANFGELRPNHYHMGLDCKTNQRENLPVLAAADGYISKVKIEPSGFGRAIYISHPNGLTTLYAHLNDFYPELEKYVKAEQYRLQSWKVFLDIPAGKFPVRKGDFIAYSGNTGGSQGPHLHFEIRDTKTDKVLNPLLFDFPIPDRIAPEILRLAVYDRSRSVYEQTPMLFPLKKVNGVYRPVKGKIVLPADKVSFAITAYDKYTGSTNQNGIFRASLSADGKQVCGFEMDSISYDETRYLNAHIDHRLKLKGGPYVEHLSKLPGNINNIYRLAKGQDGVLDMSDGKPLDIRIDVYDANDNHASLDFTVQSSGKSSPADTSGSNWFSPGMMNVFDNRNIRFYLPENALYDGFRFQYAEMKSASGNILYKLHDPSVPVHVYFPVWIKADYSLQDTGKIIMRRSYGAKDNFKKAVYENGWYRASFREFGNYELILDKEAPTVTPVGFRDGMNAKALKKLVLAVRDNTEEIGLFRAMLDGQWLLFSNDKGKNFVYTFDEHCPEGAHELIVTVEDLAGNRTEKVYRFTR